MQMLQSDWPNDCTLLAIGVHWLEVIYLMATFVFIIQMKNGEHFNANNNLIPKRTKVRTLTVSSLTLTKKRKTLKMHHKKNGNCSLK